MSWFVATHLIGIAIADSSRKGDQLFVEGKIRRHHWDSEGEEREHHICGDWLPLGVRKPGPGAANATVSVRAPNSPMDSAEEEMLNVD